MRNADGFAPADVRRAARPPRLLPAALALLVFAGLGVLMVPRGVDAGARLASENDPARIADLACVGLAITAGTYATVGAAAPARVGLTLAKAARKTGHLGGAMAARIGRMLRGVV